jgi:lipoyl(octanoyl) transferase
MSFHTVAPSHQPFLSELQLLIQLEPMPGAWNMAVDQALLELSAVAVLRVYAWSEPSISIGYRHPLSALQDLPSWPVVRRWTGGGVVLHERDVTYSLILPHTEALAGAAAAQIYRLLHGSLAAALSEHTAQPYCVAEADHAVAVQCFSGWSRSDLLLHGQKVGGAGQRRCRHGLLHQGSLQCGTLSADFWEKISQCWSHSMSVHHALDEAVQQRAAQLTQERYGLREWLEAR